MAEEKKSQTARRPNVTSHRLGFTFSPDKSLSSTRSGRRQRGFHKLLNPLNPPYPHFAFQATRGKQGEIREASSTRKQLWPESFEFVSRDFDADSRIAIFQYTVSFSNGEKINFTEKLSFPKNREIVEISKELMNTALDDLHFVLGVSYYKLYCPSKIVHHRCLTSAQADFWNFLYRNGMGEFYYRNKIDPRVFNGFRETGNKKETNFRLAPPNGALVGVGGGKESVVAVELLKDHKIKSTAFVLEAKDSLIIDGMIDKMKIDSLKIKRELDAKIFADLPDALNGHVPISAIIAFSGYFAALLFGFQKVVVGNEYSSNFGNIEYRGMAINHQWSKSAEFEEAFQNYVGKNLSPDVEYFSLLRPFYEIRITQMFAKYKKYFPVFSSCNRNFKIKEEQHKRWCGECAKCVFVFTLLSAFLTKKDLLGIFKENLYEKQSLLPLFKDLLGVGNLKPFDCVGTFEETLEAFRRSAKKYKKTFIHMELNRLLPKNENLEVMRPQKSNLKPPYFFFGMNSVLLIGYAREGKETRKYLRKTFPNLKLGIADRKYGKDYLEKQDRYDVAVKTAGIPSSLIKTPYTTATNLFFSAVPKGQIIGVTGTKGKSTTASLIHWILSKSGKKCRLLGNIGMPMLSALDKKISDNEYFVLELSSYQLEDIKYASHISVVLNLFPEHMDYHGGIEKYYAAKRNMVSRQSSDDVFVYNSEDKVLAKWAQESIAVSIPFVSDLALSINDTHLLGKHNVKNILAAATVARQLGITDEKIIKAVKDFRPLPHRLEFVGEFKGIKFFDDAISTTPESTIEAIESLKNVETIFLGGQDRGYDFSKLRKCIEKNKIKNVVLFPDTGERIFNALDIFDNVLRTKDMREAVKFAYAHTKKGSICLLSTASPSYSVWKDFEEKGNLFQKEVKIHSKYSQTV
jgi:UDP-N-acetylmuramoylalanine--D-glutamate ligase